MIDCAGYSLRHYNETRIDQRLESIENAVSVYHQRRYLTLILSCLLVVIGNYESDIYLCITFMHRS